MVYRYTTQFLRYQILVPVSVVENLGRVPWALTKFLQRVSIVCYAERCTGYSKSVRLSVCHTLAAWHCVNMTRSRYEYDHAVFTGG